MIRQAIENGNGLDKLDPILACMKRVGSLEYTQQRAEEEAAKAVASLDSIPDSDFKEAMIALAHISVHRRS